MHRSFGVIAASFTLVTALVSLGNPLFAQGQSVLRPDVELIANSKPFEFDGSGPGFVQVPCAQLIVVSRPAVDVPRLPLTMFLSGE